MIPLIGAPQHYAWGSDTAIPRAIGVPSDGRAWAELWWGTHPGGRTLAPRSGAPDTALVDVAGHLPYLVKLLAAAAPLSLQAHPSTGQAAAGFADEERRGIPVAAAHRNYRDPEGKPEIIVAVTSFEALCGFRLVDEAARDLETHGGAPVADRLRAEGPLGTLAWLLTERPPIALTHPLFRRLDAAYPGDPGAVVALLLRHFELEPGQALFLRAGVLHMYLHGIGLEVMGSSDNVLRGGLTPKHVDVPELLKVLDPAPTAPAVVRPGSDGWYPTETDAFAVRGLAGPDRWVTSGPEIVVKLAGDGGTRAWFAAAGEVVEWTGGLGCRVTRGRA